MLGTPECEDLSVARAEASPVRGPLGTESEDLSVPRAEAGSRSSEGRKRRGVSGGARMVESGLSSSTSESIYITDAHPVLLHVQVRSVDEMRSVDEWCPPYWYVVVDEGCPSGR